MHGAIGAPQGDCNQPCAGNPAEECGQGNRIQIYQDSTWFDPTVAELAIILQVYNTTLAQAVAALSTYESHIEALQALGSQAKKGKVRRDLPPQSFLLKQISSDSRTLRTVQQNLGRPIILIFNGCSLLMLRYQIRQRFRVIACSA
jgi:hypothetical protein